MMKKQQKAYLSQSEQQSLKEEKQELNSAIKEIEQGAGAGTAGSAIDVSRIKREITRIDSVLEQGSAPTPRAIEKDRLVKEELALEESIAAGMPTKFEMRRPTENPGAVRKHMEWCNRNQKNIHRYVEIQRILRPFEPKSIENLRKER